MKICSTSVVIREMQIQTRIRNYFTLIRTAIIKTKQKITNVSNDVEKLEPCALVVEK